MRIVLTIMLILFAENRSLFANDMLGHCSRMTGKIAKSESKTSFPRPNFPQRISSSEFQMESLGPVQENTSVKYRILNADSQHIADLTLHMDEFGNEKIIALTDVEFASDSAGHHAPTLTAALRELGRSVDVWEVHHFVSSGQKQGPLTARLLESGFHEVIYHEKLDLVATKPQPQNESVHVVLSIMPW